MNTKWLKSKGFIGGCTLLISALVMAGDNIFGDTRSHDWNEIVTTGATALGILGIRLKQGAPE